MKPVLCAAVRGLEPAHKLSIFGTAVSAGQRVCGLCAAHRIHFSDVSAGQTVAGVRGCLRKPRTRAQTCARAIRAQKPAHKTKTICRLLDAALDLHEQETHMTAMPTVTFRSRTYKVRSRKTEIPDLASMDDTAALMWLLRNTYPRGTNHRPAAPNLSGLSLRTR